VASGCDQEQGEVLQRVFVEQIQALPTAASRFHLHLTPDYSRQLPAVTYKFFNKPHGLLHWLEKGLGFPETLPEYQNTVIIILDPDMLISRPFTTADYTHDVSQRWHRTAETDSSLPQTVITEGHPVAQLYGFGSNFVDKIDRNVSHILAKAGYDTRQSHLHDWTAQEVGERYAAGPPYMAVASDMYRLVKTWSDFVVPVYELTTDHLSEMFAYSTAAAHLQLPHLLAYSFMVSNTGSGRQEGWNAIDRAGDRDVCEVEKHPSLQNSLPHVIHYCQRYFLGPSFFSKYKLPKNFLSCDHPLLTVPEKELAAKYNSSVTPNWQYNAIPAAERKRHAFLLCNIIRALNEAATYWKQQHCNPAAANFHKNFVFPMDTKKSK
jgi:hypothetical protein